MDDTQNQNGDPLEDKLRAEEPPIHADDTNPSVSFTLDEKLAAEEPPLSDEDTNPSLRTRHQQAGGLKPAPRRGQRLPALVMLLGALILTGAAGYIWWGTISDDSDDTPAPTGEVNIALNPTPTATQEAATQATATRTAAPPPTQVMITRDEMLVLPTAAVDEIAASLLTPAPVAVADRALQRQNEPFTIRPAGSRTDVVQYTVQDGDTLESIAEQFELDDYYSLIWSNKTNKFNPLRPGNQLNIPPVDGAYHEVRENVTISAVADQYGVEPYDIIDSEYNNLFGSSPETLLVEGMWVVVPGGESVRELFLAAAPSSSGGSGGAISGSYSLWGCSADVSGGTMPVSRPLANYRWMQGFVPGGHTGVDIAPGSGQVGDPVTATGSGTVVYAGWLDGGYGNLVVIAHGSTFSLYAHLQRASVSCNQKVGAGDVIGLLGSTGNSSGPHLHFEIRDADFNIRNPQNWIGF